MINIGDTTMKKNILVILTMVMASMPLMATHYPDSIKEQSKEQYRIPKGWNFEFGFGAGVGRFEYAQIGDKFTPAHVENKLVLPNWNGTFGINYYFVPWMGFGTGLQFSTYANKAAITTPWTRDGVNAGQNYTLTTKPTDLNEIQDLYMLEVPVAFKFRAIPRNVGFTATLGVKFGFPMYNHYELKSGGYLDNSVNYPHWALTIRDVPGVIENYNVASYSNDRSRSGYQTVNYAGYAEIGLLIRLHQRVDLAISLFGNYYFNNVMNGMSDVNLGFAESYTGTTYAAPFTENYRGVLQTNEVKELHPWSAGVKIGIQINANRTQAEKDYDRLQRELRRAARNQQPEPEPEPEPVSVEEPIVVVEPEPEPEPVINWDSIYRADAIAQILDLAQRHNINLCDLGSCGPDTVYIIRADNSQAVAELDELLQSAVIYFHLDDTVPILEPADVMDKIAAVLKRHPQQSINIDGHACKLGGKGYNKRLALRRANAVANKLSELGVRDEQMTVRSLGADVPFRYSKQHQLSKDRRVEIFPSDMAVEKVVHGTTLAKLARKYYGEDKTDYWVYIYEANKDRIVNPNDLPIGLILHIPSADEVKIMQESK